jgi:uncharacterized repeat protein (TIGR01451 family)
MKTLLPFYLKPGEQFWQPKRVLATLVLASLPALAQAQAVAFPRAASFKGTDASGFTLGGSATLTNSPAGDGALRLTTADGNQAGYAIDNQTFESGKGFSISFEFFAYGTTTTAPADGFSIFLVDADGTTPGSGFSIGAVGGSLGYAPRNAEPGVTKGYLGIGIDEFGNYGINSEGKTGGYPGRTSLLPNAVSLRGPYNSADVTRTTGYAYLAGSTTLPFNLAVGTSETDQGSRITDPNSADYRKAYINVIPVKNADGSTVYKITVRIQSGQSVTTAVNNVTVANPPTNLRVGFSGSTGGSNSIHEIRGLAVVQAPIAVDDDAQTVYGNAITIPVLANDQSSGADIDLPTVDLNPGTIARETSYTVPNQGTFEVNEMGVVTFMPLSSFAGTVTIPYTVQNKNQDISNPGTITVVVTGAEVATVASGPASLNPGQTADFTVTTTNSGQEIARNVMPMLTLPAGFTLMSTLPEKASYTVKDGVTTITFPEAVLTVGQSVAHTVQVRAASAMPSGNYAMVTDYTYPSGAVIPDAVAGNNTSTLAVAVVRPLPVQLTRFTAVAVGADALMSWETAQEINNQRFEVERSLDGTTYTTVGTVAGKGTTAVVSTYRYLDAGASARTVDALYYRLRQVDHDGKASFSPVQALHFRRTGASVVLYPNPTTGSATLDLRALPAGDYSVQVFEATGRLVRQATYQPGQPTLPLDGLGTGTYFVKVQGNGFSKVLPLSRQ